MTLSRIHHPAAFNKMVDHFLGHSFPEFFNGDSNRPLTPAVNIKESENEFTIEAALPGFQKNDFTIGLENDVLTLTAKRESQSTESAEKYMRREFGFKQFERSFKLPESVNHDGIAAQYDTGILTIRLPKKEEAKPKGLKTIEVA